MTIRRRFLTLFTATLVVASSMAYVFAAPLPGKGKPRRALSVTVAPSSIAETQGAVGTVTHNNPNLGSALQVTLSSSDTTEATVAASVTILAGETSATFPVEGVDDSVVDGDQVVTISATAKRYRSANTDLTITDEPLVNVRYRIEVIPVTNGNSLWINGITNTSIVYGWHHESGVDGRNAYAYDQTNGVFYDLNFEPSLLAQVEILLGAGWGISSLVGMNDVGQMTGYAEDEAGKRRGIVIDTSSSGQFSPDTDDWTVRHRILFRVEPGIVEVSIFRVV
jgi:hypothetical protein